jgi:hypothetical protein
VDVGFFAGKTLYHILIDDIHEANLNAVHYFPTALKDTYYQLTRVSEDSVQVQPLRTGCPTAAWLAFYFSHSEDEPQDRIIRLIPLIRDTQQQQYRLSLPIFEGNYSLKIVCKDETG